MFRMIDRSVSAVVVHGWFRFAGPMERYQAEVVLVDRENGTYLIRHRSKESSEYAISIKYVGFFLFIFKNKSKPVRSAAVLWA